MILNEWKWQPWRNWSSSDDAISWAEKKLPDIPREQLEAEFKTLESSKGKKALAWVEYVHQRLRRDP